MPYFPEPIDQTDTEVTYDIEAVRALVAFKIAAETNTEVAQAHADQIEAIRRGAEALVEVGNAQFHLTELQKQILAEERRHWFWERTAYWAGFIIIGVALTL